MAVDEIDTSHLVMEEKEDIENQLGSNELGFITLSALAVDKVNIATE